MSTRFATQRNFILATNSAAATAAAAATITATASTSNSNNNLIVADEGSIARATGPGTATATTTTTTITATARSTLIREPILCDNDIKNEELMTRNTSSCSSSHPEEYDLFDCNGTFVATGNLETVMTQKKILDGNQTTEEVAVIVVPMDASDSSNDDGIGGTESLQTISAIKDGDLAQQVASGQVTVVQSTESDEDKPQFITVTVSAQDAGQNYQVQYVDSEIYHNSAGQAQMTYPFCPVGDYQPNGQAYYSTAVASSGNYSTSVTGNTSSSSHTSSGLPYLVPVEESILLNSSSQQSQSRDSPHSLEAVYIQEAQSTPQTPTSTTTTNSVSGGSIGSGGGGASPESEQNALGNTNKIASATIMWLSRNYETADGVSLPRSTLYNHYIQHCNENKLEPVNAASFGKLIRSVFSGLRTRRLGTRGNSKYHYYGIRIKPGSSLNQVTMDDKSAVGNYVSQSNSENSSTVGSAVPNTSSGNTSTSSGGGTHSCRGPKKMGYKETYEACAQFLGNGAGAIPNFPHLELDNTFSSELTAEDVETFRSMYREHCESFLDAVLNLEFGTIEFLWRDFWRTADNNNLDECEEEKFLTKTKLYLLCHCAEVQKFIKEIDDQFYQNMVDVIIPDVLRSIPNALTQAIRTFSKNLETWLCKSMAGVPERLVQIKKGAISAFCQTLRRYTSLNHLAQAARAVLQNSSQIAQMLNDLNRVDFHNIQEQASWVCQCDPAMVQRVENDFKSALQQQITLEQWASWLQMVVESVLDEYRGKPSYVNAARQFLLNWNFYSTMVIRDLTLRSASSFGSFHLIRLLYDEYMFYLVEHKIAEAQQKTVIAVICDRKKFVDMEFEYQLELINDTNNDDAGSVPKHMKLE